MHYSIIVLLVPLLPGPPVADAFLFRDTTRESQLFAGVSKIRGHAAGWGDVDDDGHLDLYVATFHTDGSKHNLLFRNRNGAFQLDDQAAVQISTRASASLFADLDNDGDLDLYVSSMPAPPGSALAEREGRPLRGCALFRNDGAGKFTDVSEADGVPSGACPAAFGGRSATVLDYDGDSFLDLLVGEDPLPGYNGSATKSSRLFKNLGRLRFEDVTRAAGIPENVPAYGVAAADVNNDTFPDFFLAANRGGNVLFLNDGKGRFREAPGSRQTFAWADATGDNMVCGVAFGDVNRDGLLDVVLGQHYNAPWKSPVPNRLYLNRGIEDGVPRFEDVTSQVGLVPLPMKAPHVELQDFDNDGWPDLYASVVKFKDDRPHPLIFKNLGVKDGLPRFRETVLALNDFPTPEDRATNRAAQLFERVLTERKVFYSAPGPSADYDNDGRLDLFLASWWPEAPSMLLRNETPGGAWLQVRLECTNGVNRGGIGARINLYPAGKLADPTALVGTREIATGYGYASGHPALAHFGLGEITKVDVEVILPHRKGALVRKDVAANQRITLEQEEPKR